MEARVSVLRRAGHRMRSIKTPVGSRAGSNAGRREWIIQRCTQVWVGTDLRYEDWPRYAERLMTRREMLSALQECERQWPEYEFRGHNLVQSTPTHTRGINAQMHQSTHYVAFRNGTKSQTHTLPNNLDSETYT